MQFFPTSMNGQPLMFDPGLIGASQSDSPGSDFSALLSSHLDDPAGHATHESLDSSSTETSAPLSDPAGSDENSAARSDANALQSSRPEDAAPSAQGDVRDSGQPAKVAAPEEQETAAASDGGTDSAGVAAKDADVDAARECATERGVVEECATDGDSATVEPDAGVAVVVELVAKVRALLADVLTIRARNQTSSEEFKRTDTSLKTIGDLLQRIQDALAEGKPVSGNAVQGALATLKTTAHSVLKDVKKAEISGFSVESTGVRQMLEGLDVLEKKLDEHMGSNPGAPRFGTSGNSPRKQVTRREAAGMAGAESERTAGGTLAVGRASEVDASVAAFEVEDQGRTSAGNVGPGVSDERKTRVERVVEPTRVGESRDRVVENLRGAEISAGTELDGRGRRAEVDAGQVRDQGVRPAPVSAKEEGGASSGRQSQDSRQGFFSLARSGVAETARASGLDSPRTFAATEAAVQTLASVSDTSQRVADTAMRVRSADVYRQVESGAFRNLGQGAKQLVIRLAPEDLGQVTVVLQVRGKEVQATLRTTTQDASQALNEQLGQLRTQLESQGLKVGKLEVQTQLADSETQSQWQGAEHHNRYQENREFAMTAQRMRTLGRLDGDLVRDVQVGSYREKNSSGGLDLFA